MRAACSMLNRLESILPRNVCVGGIAYRFAPSCDATQLTAPKTWALRSACEQKSMTVEAAADREVAASSVVGADR